MKVYRYRLYPTKAQKTVLNRSLELCRLKYKETLALKRIIGNQNRKELTITILKK
jgi:putative transposase